MQTATTEPRTIRVTDIRTGEHGVIVDYKDNGRVKVLVKGRIVRYYAPKDVASVLKRRNFRMTY